MHSEQFWQLLLDDGWLATLAQGALRTLAIAVGAFVLGLLIGLLVALMKLNGPRWLVLWANTYTTLYRAVPELLLILLLYFAGADLINSLLALLGWPPVAVNGLIAAIVILGVVQGAYSAEILRGAMLAIAPGQVEAGRALGMNRWLLLRRVQLPAMLPYAVAGLFNLWLVLVKDCALISVVGYGELLSAGRQAAASSKWYLSFYLLVALFYYLITLASGQLLRVFEPRLKRWQPQHH